MAREETAVSAISTVARAVNEQPANSFSALRQIFDAILPDMPKDLKSRRIESPIDPAKVLTFNYDEGHAGRLSVPETPGGSVAFAWAMEQSQPHAYIMENLAFRDQVATASPDDELVVFVPGLNTLHQPAEGETTTMQRVEYYARVLLTVPMAHMHIGTSFDQGDIAVDASRSPVLLRLLSEVQDKLPSSVKPEIGDDGSILWRGRQIDNLQTGLSQVNLIDTPVKEHMRMLCEDTKGASARPFALMVYSRASIECAAALRKHMEESIEQGESESDIEQRLRKYATVLTVGNASRKYPDGPAYIHLASRTDPLTTGSGVTVDKPEGGGSDAVFLTCDSPYHAEAFDNHNFGAVTGQYLALVMALSAATGLRDLWEKGHAGDIVEPEQGSGLTRAMIQMTRGYEWLWNEEAAWKDIPMGALPDSGAAAEMLREKVGAPFVERLICNFGGN